MTKKDYRSIAQGLANARPPLKGSDRYDTWFHTVAEISARLARDNPRFSYDLFKSAAETLPFYAP